MEIDDLLMQCYIDDGYTEEEAKKTIAIDQRRSNYFINKHKVGSAQDLISLLATFNLQFDDLMRFSPYFAESVKGFHLSEFIERNGVISDRSLKNILRYLELPSTDIDLKKIITDGFLSGDPPKLSRRSELLSIYLDKLMGLGETTTQVVDYVHDSLSILPAMSRVPLFHDDLIYGPIKRASGIKAVRRDSIAVGTCSDLEKFHDATLFDNFSDYFGRRVLIYCQDQLIGSLKMKLAPSMLALSNVKAEDGTYPLVLGGTYALQKSVVYAVSEKFESRVKRINLDGLIVRPLRFAGQKSAGDKINGLEQVREWQERLAEYSIQHS